MRILLFSRYDRLGASSRIRSLQYIPYLNSKGITVDVSPLFSNYYLEMLYSGKTRWREILFGYWNRTKKIFSLSDYDVIWLEKELFPFCPAFIERFLRLVGISYIVDYDDALFHRYDQHRSWLVRKLLGKKIDTVMRCAALVIVGNDYLAQRADKAGAKNIKVVPTVIDLERYPIIPRKNQKGFVVGWIGSPSTEHYLTGLTSVFESLKKEFDVSFVAIGANPKNLEGTPIKVEHWSEETEVSSIREFDIGIMPLFDSPWERGKCGYKLIQYMACGIPVIASAVGVNNQIVKENKNGFLIKNFSDWECMLSTLLQNEGLRHRMGKKGREQVESWYSIQSQAPRIVNFINEIFNCPPN